MTTDLEPTIDQYLNHFIEKVQRLEKYDLHAEDRLLKKTIIVSMLDAISRPVTNIDSSNRVRFTSLIDRFSDWHQSNKVSATHLSFLLQKLRAPEYESARKFIHEIVDKNTNGRVIYLDEDPNLSEIERDWPVSKAQKVYSQMSLESFTHLNLFYSYRNSLVHELREPGQGFEISESADSPYYFGHITDQGASLELIYPLQFHYRLIRSVLTSMRPYLIENRIDPYLSYEFGSSFIESLNN